MLLNCSLPYPVQFFFFVESEDIKETQRGTSSIMLHNVPDIFSVEVVGIISFVMILCFGFNEIMADRTLESVPLDHFLEEHSSSVVTPRAMALPMYWVWFDAELLLDYLKSFGRVDLLPLLILCLFNAAVNTWVVAAWWVAVSLWLARHVVPLGNVLLKLCWIVPVVGMVADLAEDLAMMVIVLNYPVTDYPALREVVAYSSTIKFMMWLVISILDMGLGVCWLRRYLQRQRKQQ